MTRAERELLLAFKAWAKGKGVMFDTDVRLARAIARVLDIELVFGSSQPADTPEEAGACPSCGVGDDGTWDTHFDRSLCACGAMHTYCNECGRSVENCEFEEAGA